MPKISVIMGIYNAEGTLGCALDSILAQIYADWELIICDDGSTDRSYEIAKEYFRKYSERIILLHHDTNEGLASALNACLSVARGEYIARMDADDESLPNRFQWELEFLESHPDVDLVGCAMQVFCGDEDWGVIYPRERPTKLDLGGSVPFPHPTIMARRRVFDELKGYKVSELTRRCEDRELWYRFFEAGFTGVNLQEVLYRFRNGLEAIHRRNLKERWHGFLVSVAGIHRLSLPAFFYLLAFLRLLRGFVPSRMMRWYQARRRLRQR